jgi:uncharacterized coiled-coil protein SlyX
MRWILVLLFAAWPALADDEAALRARIEALESQVAAQVETIERLTAERNARLTPEEGEAARAALTTQTLRNTRIEQDLAACRGDLSRTESETARARSDADRFRAESVTERTRAQSAERRAEQERSRAQRAESDARSARSALSRCR